VTTLMAITVAVEVAVAVAVAVAVVVTVAVAVAVTAVQVPRMVNGLSDLKLLVLNFYEKMLWIFSRVSTNCIYFEYGLWFLLFGLVEQRCKLNILSCILVKLF